MIAYAAEAGEHTGGHSLLGEPEFWVAVAFIIFIALIARMTRASVLEELREAGADVPVVVGGIIPKADEEKLLAAGVARVYTPKDFEVSKIMGDIVDLVAERNSVAASA